MDRGSAQNHSGRTDRHVRTGADRNADVRPCRRRIIDAVADENEDSLRNLVEPHSGTLVRKFDTASRTRALNALGLRRHRAGIRA